MREKVVEATVTGTTEAGIIKEIMGVESTESTGITGAGNRVNRSKKFINMVEKGL